MARHAFSTGLLIWQICSLFSSRVAADGTGLLGLGKWLYRPTCAHSCRRFIIYSDLVCEDDGADGHAGGGHSHGSSSPSTECFLSNTAFLRTMALCLNEHCAKDDVPLSTLQEYWEGHLATGTLSDTSLVPAMPYQSALADAQEEEQDRTLTYLVQGEELNQTMLIRDENFQAMLNYQRGFELGEIGHGRNSIAVTITAIGIPILFSISALLPFRFIKRFSAVLDQPLLGQHYRVPFMRSGTMPTRGQALFLGYLVIINMVLMCLPLDILQPNARLPGAARQRLQVISDRAGALAAANFVPLLVTSSRNNLLLWITNWSQTTFLLTHRWLGYIVVIQTVMHSVGLLHYYLLYSDHASESQLPYWYWGIISTLAICLIWPLAVLPIRQKAYEIFLVTHQILAVLAFIGYFLHIYYLFDYDWGYEIWVYAAGGIWFADRFLRVLRMARNGMPRAQVTSVSGDCELLRIDIPGVHAEGHVYAYFPTLTWRFWENHPFSVLSSFTTEAVTSPSSAVASSSSSSNEKTAARESTSQPAAQGSSLAYQVGSPCTSLLLRPQKGTTLNLLSRVRSNGGSLSIPIFLESSYHAQPTSPVNHCSSLLCIAGGVGITAVLPTLRSYPGPHAQLYWGVKNDDITQAVTPELAELERKGNVKVDVRVGERWDVDSLVAEEALAGEKKGDLGVMVCGPPEMADAVRRAVGRVSAKTKRGVVFIDEAFSW